MNQRNVRTVRDSGARSATKPAPFLSRHPNGSVRSARELVVFIAGSPAGQNQRASTIDLPFFIRRILRQLFLELRTLQTVWQNTCPSYQQ